MSMHFTLTRFALPVGEVPRWSEIEPLIESVGPEGLGVDWDDLFLDFPEIASQLDPYEDSAASHSTVLPDLKAQLRQDVDTVREAVEEAPARHIACSEFGGYKLFFLGGMVEGRQAANETHAAAQRLQALGGLQAAGFEGF